MQVAIQTAFATGESSPVDLVVAPNGNLMYLSIFTGTVFQDYNGNGLLDTAGTAGAIATDKGISGVTVTAYGLPTELEAHPSPHAASTMSMKLP